MTDNRKLPALRRAIGLRSAIAWAGFAACCTLCMLPAWGAQTTKPSPVVARAQAAIPASQTSLSLADQPPTAATVTFHSGLLTVHAQNSTLLQILQAITAQTGMQVVGLPGNHRVFGTYGPGKPDIIVTNLLSGFGFNYLVVGTARNGAPKKLVIAGASAAMPEEPTIPVNSIQPASPESMPQPEFGPRPEYQPSRNYEPRRAPSTRQQPSSQPQTVRTPQEILKELEAMHAGGPHS